MTAKRRKTGSAAPEPSAARFGSDDFLRVGFGLFLVALPFVLSLTGEDKFRLPKLLFAMAACVVLVAVYLGSRRPRIRLDWKSWEAWVVLGVAFVGVRCLFTPDPWHSLQGFFHLATFAAMAFVLKDVATPRFQRVLWFLIGVTGAVSSLMTILQYFGKFPLFLGSGGDPIQGRLNAAGLIGDVQSGALLFALCALMLLHWVITPSGPAVRIGAGALVAMNLAGLAFTRTLTALAAFGLVALLWFAFHHWWQLRRREGGRRALALVWVLLLVGAGIAYFAGARSGLTDRVGRVLRLIERGDWTVATAGRQPVYAMTWEMIGQAPIGGVGPERFGAEFFEYRSETPQGRERELIEQPGAFQQVHNDYLEFWLELGIAGPILFLGTLAIPLWSALRRLRRETPEQGYWLALNVLGILFIALDALGFFPFQTTLGAALAVLLLASLLWRESPAPLEVDPGFARRDQKIRWAAVVVLASVLLYPLWRVWSANVEIGQATVLLQRAYQPDTPLRVSRAVARGALDYLERAEEKCRRCYRLYDLKGSALLLLGRYADAVESYRIAAYYLPSSEVFTNLGQAYVQSRKPREARESFEKALRYRPGYTQARQALDRLRQP